MTRLSDVMSEVRLNAGELVEFYYYLSAFPHRKVVIAQRRCKQPEATGQYKYLVDLAGRDEKISSIGWRVVGYGDI